MCIYYPSTLDEMITISGVGDTKLESYGTDFTKEIKAHLDKNPDISIPDRKPVASSVNTPRQKRKEEQSKKPMNFPGRGFQLRKLQKPAILRLPLSQDTLKA